MQEHLNKIFSEYKIKARCIGSSSLNGSCIYDVDLINGGKIKDLEKHIDEIGLKLKTEYKPILSKNIEKGLVRLEVIHERNNVDLLSQSVILKNKTDVYIGNTLRDEHIIFDITKNPHMLIAGTTGSGKSTLLHTIISNLIKTNTELYLVDTKKIEFEGYEKIKNIEVINTYEDTLELLTYLNEIMSKRYESISYKHEPIVLIIDEYADVIMQDKNKQVYINLLKLIQKCRAANIFCILATQRPSVDILNGAIKANFPARISCKVSSIYDSRIILDEIGAEKLLGCGDAIIKNYNHNSIRFQIAYIKKENIIDEFGTENSIKLIMKKVKIKEINVAAGYWDI